MLAKVNSYLAKEITKEELYNYFVELETKLSLLGENNFLNVNKENKTFFTNSSNIDWINDYRHQIILLKAMSESINSFLDNKMKYSFFLDSIIDLYTDYCCYIVSVPKIPSALFNLVVNRKSLLDRGIPQKPFTNQEIFIISSFIDMVSIISNENV